MDASDSAAEPVTAWCEPGQVRRYCSEPEAGHDHSTSPVVVVVIAIQGEVDSEGQSTLREKIHALSQSLCSDLHYGSKNISVDIRPSKDCRTEKWAPVQHDSSLVHTPKGVCPSSEHNAGRPGGDTPAFAELFSHSPVGQADNSCISGDEQYRFQQDGPAEVETSPRNRSGSVGISQQQTTESVNERRDSAVRSDSDQSYIEHELDKADRNSSFRASNSPRAGKGPSAIDGYSDQVLGEQDVDGVLQKSTTGFEQPPKPKRKSRSIDASSEVPDSTGNKRSRIEPHANERQTYQNIQRPLLPAPRCPVDSLVAFMIEAIQEGLQTIMTNPTATVHMWECNISDLKPTGQSLSAESFSVYAEACHQHSWISTFFHQCEIVLRENRTGKRTEEDRRAYKMVVVVSSLINTLFTKLKTPANAYHVLTTLSVTTKRLLPWQVKYIIKAQAGEVGQRAAAVLANDSRWEGLQRWPALDPLQVLGSRHRVAYLQQKLELAQVMPHTARFPRASIELSRVDDPPGSAEYTAMGMSWTEGHTLQHTSNMSNGVTLPSNSYPHSAEAFMSIDLSANGDMNQFFGVLGIDWNWSTSPISEN